LVRKAAELGFLGILIPEAYGGAGQDHLAFALLIEAIAHACGSTAVIIDVHTSVGTEPLARYGTEEQKRRYLPALAKGDKLAAFALTEPEAGSDAAALRTTARRVDGGYVLNGEKLFITNAGPADLYLVMAAKQPGEGPTGVSAFLVEKGTAGFSIGTPFKKMGLRGSPTAPLVFTDCFLPGEQRLGAEGEGFAIAMRALDSGRIGISAQAVGLAQGALDDACAHLRQRQQFGKPLAELQGLQFMVADMATRIQAARLLTYRAAVAYHGGERVTKTASIAKLFATDMAMAVTLDALQLLGGYGFLEDYPMSRRVRDAKAAQIYEGTNQIQRMVIARELLKAR
jgi:alkylation response protein AidB-like acyl-CoA dehydrogenase